MSAPPAPAVVHLIVGPDQHGVVRHALQVARACGDPIIRAVRPDQVDLDELGDFPLVHIPYCDRLFADRCEDSAVVFEQLVAPLLAREVALSTTLHDLPAGDSPLEIRRRAAYARAVASARGIVVGSPRELELLAHIPHQARSLRNIPIPVTVETGLRPAEPGHEVVVLGFVFPGRGYEYTIAELPPGLDLIAMGAPSVGHDDLPDLLARHAEESGHRMTTTGFVSDADLPMRLATAGIPVAPNRRVAASASIATWLSHGRRPLVPDTPYSRALAERWPGTLTLYDPDQPGDLRRAIERAQADPGLTWLAPGTQAGPTLAETAAAYDRHFIACAPDAPIQVGPDRWIVPDNRWDLLAGLSPADPPSVSVVIPYYEAQAQLDLVLTALTLQTHPRLQVVVADDGSSRPPDLGAAGGLDVQLVHQDNRGFRAAAARNLGAAPADGEVLLFLDGDTIPEPDYVRRLSRLPALNPDTLTVGRRRHADLTGWSPDRLTAWLTDGAEPPPELTEPGWLVDGYRDSADLLHVDARSYRYVISAVCGLHRDLFAELGGFTEEFTSYGGEDWELAHRAWVAGSVLAHVRDAVAWHDGEDWAGRSAASRVDGKNAETMALARWLPDPIARGGGQWLPYPAIVVKLPVTDPAAVLATARSAFAGDTDCGLWLTGPSASAAAANLADPRIHPGPVPDDVRDRASVVVDLTGPASLLGLTELAATAQRCGRLSTPAGTFTATRVLRRTARWTQALEMTDDDLAARLFGGQDFPAPTPLRTVDLAHELSRTYRSTRRS